LPTIVRFTGGGCTGEGCVWASATPPTIKTTTAVMKFDLFAICREFLSSIELHSLLGRSAIKQSSLAAE
jgi:hypothetical protein